MKTVIGTKEILFLNEGKLFISHHFECDVCGKLCAALVKRYESEKAPIDDLAKLKKFAFDRFLFFVPYVPLLNHVPEDCEGPDHIVLGHNTVECKICGESEKVAPNSVDMAITTLRDFKSRHLDCEKEGDDFD